MYVFVCFPFVLHLFVFTFAMKKQSRMDRIFLQKTTYAGMSVVNGGVVDISAKYGIYPSEAPFLVMGDMKDAAKRDWPDEDGIDVFYGNATPPMKDYDIEITCMAKADSVEALRTNINSFIAFIKGDDGKGNVFMMYDEHCRSGRQKVRFVSFDEQSYYNLDMDDEKQLTFKVKFHVDDPRSVVAPSYGVDGKTVTGLEVVR